MRLFVQESKRYVVERAKGNNAITVTELHQALTRMPSGYKVVSLVNNDDGTTTVNLQANERKEVKV